MPNIAINIYLILLDLLCQLYSICREQIDGFSFSLRKATSGRILQNTFCKIQKYSTYIIHINRSMEIGIYFEDVNYYTENLNELIDCKIQNFNSENIF